MPSSMPRWRHCASGSTRLNAAAGGAPERQTLRQVSVLFMDVVGSTTLSRALDPEDIHAVMDGLLARCTAQVEAHGGKVLQYAGDSLLGQLLGLDFADSPHVRGIVDDAASYSGWRASANSRWCCGSTTCTGPMTARSISSSSSRAQAAAYRC
jgi:class 3 adenylate cyclase